MEDAPPALVDVFFTASAGDLVGKPPVAAITDSGVPDPTALEFRPRLDDIFPPDASRADATQTATFCFPQGLRLRTEPRKPVLFSSVLTSGQGVKKFAVVLLWWELLDAMQCVRLFTDNGLDFSSYFSSQRRPTAAATTAAATTAATAVAVAAALLGSSTEGGGCGSGIGDSGGPAAAGAGGGTRRAGVCRYRCVYRAGVAFRCSKSAKDRYQGAPDGVAYNDVIEAVDDGHGWLVISPNADAASSPPPSSPPSTSPSPPLSSDQPQQLYLPTHNAARTPPLSYFERIHEAGAGGGAGGGAPGDAEEPEDLIIYAPRCMCVTSEFFFLTAFSTFLRGVYRIAVASVAPAPIERYIQNFCSEIPVPPRGRIEVCLSVADSAISLSRPPRNQPPMAEDALFTTLFESLDVNNVVLVWTMLLTESKVVSE